MLGFGISIYWKLTWTIIIPIALLVIFVDALIDYQPMVTDNGKPYPAEDTGHLILVFNFFSLHY